MSVGHVPVMPGRPPFPVSRCLSTLNCLGFQLHEKPGSEISQAFLRDRSYGHPRAGRRNVASWTAAGRHRTSIPPAAISQRRQWRHGRWQQTGRRIRPGNGCVALMPGRRLRRPLGCAGSRWRTSRRIARPWSAAPHGSRSPRFRPRRRPRCDLRASRSTAGGRSG